MKDKRSLYLSNDVCSCNQLHECTATNCRVSAWVYNQNPVSEYLPMSRRISAERKGLFFPPPLHAVLDTFLMTL
jgi:hypothetical protein